MNQTITTSLAEQGTQGTQGTQGAQLNEAALAVLARDTEQEGNGPAYGVSAGGNASPVSPTSLIPMPILCPVASLLLTSCMPFRPMTDLSLFDHLKELGVSTMKTRVWVNDLAREGAMQETLAARLADAGSNPARLREMSLAEATEYLAGYIAQLHRACSHSTLGLPKKRNRRGAT